MTVGQGGICVISSQPPFLIGIPMDPFFVSRFDKKPFMGQIVIGAIIHNALQGLIDFFLQLRVIF